MLKSLHTFPAIKHCQPTTIGQVIYLARGLLKKWVHICARRGKAVKQNKQGREPPATMLLSQTWWPWRPPLLSEIVPRHNKSVGDIGKKYRWTAGVSAHWFETINNKKHIYSQKIHTFLLQVRRSAANRIIFYRLKDELIWFNIIASMCGGDHEPPHDECNCTHH